MTTAVNPWHKPLHSWPSKVPINRKTVGLGIQQMLALQHSDDGMTLPLIDLHELDMLVLLADFAQRSSKWT